MTTLKKIKNAIKIATKAGDRDNIIKFQKRLIGYLEEELTLKKK